MLAWSLERVPLHLKAELHVGRGDYKSLNFKTKGTDRRCVPHPRGTGGVTSVLNKTESCSCFWSKPLGERLSNTRQNCARTQRCPLGSRCPQGVDAPENMRTSRECVWTGVTMSLTAGSGCRPCCGCRAHGGQGSRGLQGWGSVGICFWNKAAVACRDLDGACALGSRRSRGCQEVQTSPLCRRENQPSLAGP